MNSEKFFLPGGIEADGEINWNKSNIEILRLINASGFPYSGAFSYVEEIKYYIHDATIVNDDENFCSIVGQIAKIDRTEEFIEVITGKGKIRILKISKEDQKINPPTIFFNSLGKRFKSF